MLQINYIINMTKPDYSYLMSQRDEESDCETDILEFLKDYPGSNRDEIAAQIGYKPKTVGKVLSKLRKSAVVLEAFGRDRRKYYLGNHDV